jgi:HEAT repeat protein
MSTFHTLLLNLGMLLPMADVPAPTTTDPARLREMLHDRQHPRSQSQAALLLVQCRTSDAEDIVRRGLRQTDSPEVFFALAAALRVHRDHRFLTELLTALSGGQASIRQAAAETLAELADADAVVRLRALAGDAKVEPAARQLAVWTLGRCGLKTAVLPLLDQLASDQELLRQAAVEALTELTGQTFGPDVARWRSWWESHKNLANERWLEERLAYHASRSRRLAGELERAKVQIVQLHQQLYSRLPAADRLNHVQNLAETEDPTVRLLAVGWSLELLPLADAVGQRALADLLLRFSHDGNLDVQRSAVLALGRLQDPRAFDRLRVLLERGQAVVRAAAARGLARQVKGDSHEALARQRQAVPALQKALDDPALEVVVEAAESLGTLGIPEAGPVLTVLLRHPSYPVRQTAAQALERVADPTVLDGLLEALDDPSVTIRFSLIGAIGHSAGDGRTLSEAQHTRLQARLEGLLLRDADPAVRSRAATVLGECGSPAILPALWRRVLATEDSRVQEKAWTAIVEILVRSGNLDLLHDWDQNLIKSRQGPRRVQLWHEVVNRWRKREDTRTQIGTAQEMLVQAQLEQGRWAAALPVVRELLARPGSDPEVDKRLRWLLTVGEQALKDGNRAEVLRVTQEAQAHLSRRESLASQFERLAKQAREGP